MAHVTLFQLTPAHFRGDTWEQLIAGDGTPQFLTHNGMDAMAFDDTDEEAAVTPLFVMPGQYAGTGTLKATIELAAASDDTNGCVFDLFLQAVTPNADNLDMTSNTSWDSANSSGDIDLSGVTAAGDLISVTITLSNDDGVAALDGVRVGIRRDTDHGSDDASGDIYVYTVEVWEDT